jgi:hypothetical protein
VQVAPGVASGAPGALHSPFANPAGTLWTLGYNGYGQLGDGTSTTRNPPVQVASGVASASAGEQHSLIIKMDGTLWATGNNYHGQLGDGTFDHRTLPIRVGAVTFAVTAIGQGPLSYQWKKGGVNIAGATSATYYIANPQAGDAGSYTVVVTNAFGSTTSNAATLTVHVAPTIATHPVSQAVNSPGQDVTFSVAASGSVPLTGRVRRQPAKGLDDDGTPGRSRDGRIPARSRHGHHGVFRPAQGLGQHRGPFGAGRGRNRREGL